MQQTFKNNKNILYLVSTPIGNLLDITYRAIDVLNSSIICYAEDTRRTKVLFDHYKIETKLSSFHDFNEDEKIKDVLESLSKGNVSLVSDAGTPLISDPGYKLVLKVIEEGYNVSAIPGASAILSSLIPSGIETEPFLYLGFLPRKEKEQISYLDKYKNVDATLIIYESPLRIKKTLNMLFNILGNRKITITKELTKIYETFIRTNLKDSLDLDILEKGEFVLVVEKNKEIKINETFEETYERLVKLGFDNKNIIKEIALIHRVSKREVYQNLKVKKEG